MSTITLEVSDQRSRQYRVTTAFRLLVAGELVEMLEENTLSFRLTGARAEEKFFNLKVLDHRQEANREVFEWARIVNQALDHIHVATQGNGKAIRLSIVDPASKHYLIHQQLEQQYRDRPGWQEMAQRVQQYIHQPHLLLPHIQDQGWYPLFFHGLYGQHSTDTPEIGARVFPGLVGGIDLPLELQCTFPAPDTAHPHPRLQVQGRIDPHRFDRRGLVAWLKTLYDGYDLPVQE
jgi:hypothetical protein